MRSTKLLNIFKPIGLFYFTALLWSHAALAEPLINIEVQETAMHEVSFADLIDFGLDITGEPIADVALTNQGQAVAIEITGSTLNPNVMGQGASIRFLGEAIDTLYTGTNVYTLHLNRDLVARIEAIEYSVSPRAPFASSYLAKKRFAPQQAYSFTSPNDQDPWYAKRIAALDAPQQERVDMRLDDMLPGGNSGSLKAKLKVDVWGASNMPGSDTDHHIRVSINGQAVASKVFDGFERQVISSEVNNLQIGNNVVSLELPLDQGERFDAVNLDAIEISYPRAFIAQNNELMFTSRFKKFRVRGFEQKEISVYSRDSQSIQRIENASIVGRCPDRGDCGVDFGGSGQVTDYYVVADSQFRSPTLRYLPLDEDIRSGSAEYLIVTHPDFIAQGGEVDQLGRLVDSLEETFSSVDVVDVEQIYAQFANHVFDPLAIQRYLQFAQEQRATQFVLLVGGDIYDYRDFENQDAQSFIPSLYVATDDLIRFAPADAKYVDFDNDNVPDMPIGRLPVRSMGELKVLIDKRETYLGRDYQQTAVFAADRFSDIEQYSFTLDAERIRNDYFPTWNVAAAYIDEIGSRDARDLIRNSINNGVSLTSFFGHSSTNQWSFDGLFTGFDAANLQNSGKPTIVTQWGCWNTYHVNPNEDSMGHQFLMTGDRGAVAVMGATTLTSAHHERLLADLVYKELASGLTLGEAITKAKAELAKSMPDALDVLLGWNLLGSPELTL